MAAVAKIAKVSNTADPLHLRYNEDEPGMFCLSHRSVFCEHVQAVIMERLDAETLTEVITSSIGDMPFVISLPIYPQYCIWEILPYQALDHDSIGPMAELVGKNKPRHRVVQRILPGESAADLAFSLRDAFEAEMEATEVIERLKRAKPAVPGIRNDAMPSCKNSSHTLRYQRLINEMIDPSLLNAEWDSMREGVYALLWTFHYYEMCLFCWTKSARPDAIRVSPDFAVVDSPSKSDHSDLVPTAADTNRRKPFNSSDSTSAPW